MPFLLWKVESARSRVSKNNATQGAVGQGHSGTKGRPCLTPSSALCAEAWSGGNLGASASWAVRWGRRLAFKDAAGLTGVECGGSTFVI